MSEEVKTEAGKKINLSPVAFNPVGDLKITTTDELGMMINDVMTQAFKDYYGCKLTVQFMPDRQAYYVVPSLIFQVLPKDQYDEAGIAAFKPLEVMNTDSLVNRVQRLSQISRTAGAKVDITEDAKSMLEEFVVTPANKNQKLDWSTCYRSIGTDTGTYIEVFKLDAIKLVKKLFGATDEYGSEYFYQITPSYKLNANNQYRSPDNWVLNILRLNNENELATANLLGMYVAPKSGINVITATSGK